MTAWTTHASVYACIISHTPGFSVIHEHVSTFVLRFNSIMISVLLIVENRRIKHCNLVLSVKTGIFNTQKRGPDFFY